MKELFTGTVDRAEIKIEAPYMPRYWARGEKDVYLEVGLRLDNGEAVYFKTPRGRRWIASCPVAAFPVVSLSNEVKNWIAEDNGDNPIATPGRPSTARLVALVDIGSRITVEGTVKYCKVSRKGNPYTVINRVKLIKKGGK